MSKARKAPKQPSPTGDFHIGVGDLVIDAKAKRYLHQVINSNRLSYGPFTRKFEARFAQDHGCRFGVFCNSGTSALHVALTALKDRFKWKDGDEVLVPAVTFIATSNIVLHNNMKPVFVDVCPKTYNIDPDQIERHINKRTRAIIPVHLMGLPADMTAINKIAKKRKLKVIEDSCETMFAKCDGEPVGCLSDIGTFSTYVAHFLVTGVGGLAITDNPDLAIDLRSLCNHGRDSIYLNIDDDDNKQGEDLFNIVRGRFRFVRLGHSMRCTEMEAALGLAQLEGAHKIIEGRRRNAHFLTKQLTPLADRLQLPCEPAGRDHVYMLYPLVTLSEDKWGLVRHLEEHGIETRDLMPLTNQPVYLDMFGRNLENRFPRAKFINNHGFYIGCHQYITRQELEFVVETIFAYFKSR